MATTYNLGRVGYVNKGGYNPTAVYEEKDAVVYQNGYYEYTNPTPSAGNVPTNTTYWKVMLDPTAMNAATETANSAGAHIGPDEPTNENQLVWIDTEEEDIALYYRGTGSPEGVIAAIVGSLYFNTSGGSGTTLYVKETGTGNTGWAAK